MSLKMLKIGGTLLGFMLALALSSRAADGQQVNGVWTLTPQTSAANQGIARDPQPTVFIVMPSSGFNTGFNSGLNSRTVFPRQPIAFTMIPAIIMSDGTVVADFGFGFEPVVRSCSGVVVVGQPRVMASNGVVLSQGTPSYTQPVPAQTTPSQQILPSAQGRNGIVSAAAQTACFSRDATGRVVVFR
jgi:hypothetical protein